VRLSVPMARVAASVLGMVLIATSLVACTTDQGLGTVIARSTISANNGGTVGAPNGVELSVPPGVLKTDSEAQIIEVGPHQYDIHINGDWSGKVAITLPLSGENNAIAHRVGDTWVLEGDSYGQSKVWVSQLSWFSDLVDQGKNVLCLTFSVGQFLDCLLKKGVKHVNSAMAQWISEKLDQSCALNVAIDAAAKDYAAIVLDIVWSGPCVGTANAPSVPETTKPAPEQPAPNPAPQQPGPQQPAPQPAPPAATSAPPPPAPSGRVADGGYVGYAKNSKNPSDPNYYYWHYLSICVSNMTSGTYTLNFSNDSVSNYRTMSLQLPADGCVSTGQQGGTSTQSGLSSDWFKIEVVGQFFTPQYQPWS